MNDDGGCKSSTWNQVVVKSCKEPALAFLIFLVDFSCSCSSNIIPCPVEAHQSREESADK